MSLAQRPVSVSVDCSAKIDHLAKFSALPVPGREPEGVRGEVDVGRAFGHPSLCSNSSASFVFWKRVNVTILVWTILNIKQGSGYGLKARNLRYDQFTM